VAKICPYVLASVAGNSDEVFSGMLWFAKRAVEKASGPQDLRKHIERLCSDDEDEFDEDELNDAELCAECLICQGENCGRWFACNPHLN